VIKAIEAAQQQQQKNWAVADYPHIYIYPSDNKWNSDYANSGIWQLYSINI
jgi:hypothetical protein